MPSWLTLRVSALSLALIAGLGGLPAASQPALASQIGVVDEPEAPVAARMVVSSEKTNVTEVQGVVTAAQQQAARDYWTVERLQEASRSTGPSASRQVNTNSERAVGEARVVQDPVAAPERTVSERVLPSEPVLSAGSHGIGVHSPIGKFAPANGKLFFYNPALRTHEQCSASSVGSSSRSIVATAAHCIYDFHNKTMMTNIVFVPAYHHKQRPYGTFPVLGHLLLTDFIEYGYSGRGYSSDVAMLKVGTNERGQLVNNAVGGHALVTGGSNYKFGVVLFGYPYSHDPEAMHACAGRTSIRRIQRYRFSFTECPFRRGMSGGPWLRNYDKVTGLGELKSVTTSRSIEGSVGLYGLFFHPGVGKLFHDMDQWNPHYRQNNWGV